MEAQNLRIGNYVSAKSPEREKWEEPYIIGLWDLESLLYYKERINIKPISLTEEWLLKFGFQKNDINNDYKYWLIDDSRFLIQTDKFYFSAWLNIIESVNQLQNLYFALKGKELTIKEK